MGNAVHDSFNRAFTLHGDRHMRLINNVVFNALGHAFFMEDAVETQNII